MTSRLLIPSAVRRRMYGPCPRVVSQPDDDYAIERRVGLAVATAVESVSVRLAR